MKRMSGLPTLSGICTSQEHGFGMNRRFGSVFSRLLDFDGLDTLDVFD
jgi:hypothetical protein